MAHFVTHIQPSLSELQHHSPHHHHEHHHDHTSSHYHETHQHASPPKKPHPPAHLHIDLHSTAAPAAPPPVPPVKESDGNTSFLRAARAGHLDKVLEQLRNNVDINTSNANGLNALHLASKDGHVHVVTELLKRGANVDSATKKGNTALHIASLAGQEEVVRLLVEHGASVNVQSQNGFTPLYMAAQENHDNVVKYLLANGANQSLATEDGFTPLAVAMQQGHDKVVAVLLENDTRGKVRLPALHIAAKKDDCKAAALLLQNEHNPDVTSKSGFTPLHIASHYGNEGIANLLLNKGADVNYSAKHNITPLHVAAKWGKSNMVSLLLEKGANIESKTRDGLTPLHCAARSGHEQVVDMLLERGAPISCKTKNGLAPLHMSSQGDHVDAARILLYHRAPVDEVTVDYLTALHVAAHCGHARVAKLLLDRKADPNARALNGFTPLHIACKKNRIKVVELLLKHGASIEATTESGLTPLHVASFMGCMNIVIYLLQNEANPDVPTVRGETPLHLAARANQTDIIRILLRNGAQVDARAREQQTPLHIAARLGNVDIVMLLLQHGAAVDCTTKDLYSALHIAAKEGQDEVAAVLLENGASPTATTKKGFTPLHLAAKYGNMKVARLLLQRDAPVDAQGKNGVTPLHVASHYDHQNVALLLLDKGASPHATAKNGHTPLHIAAKKNQMDIATTLLEYGAKASAESKAGFTPLHLSAQEGHIDMSSLLIDHQADTNHKAKNGLTPLHLCAQEDRVSVASVLVKNGAEIDTTTKAGYTPLHVACHFGQLNMVRFLLDEGSKVSTSTAVGYTPLHQAAQQGHCAIINTLLEHGAPPNATTNQGQTAMSIAQKLGYISVVETLKGVTEPTTITPSGTDEKYKVVSPETMQETFMSDSEDEGGEDTLLSEQPYRYLTVDEMKSLGDDSLPIDVRQDERIDSNRECMTVPPTAVDDTISPQHLKEAYSQFTTPDNIDISKHTMHVGFLVSFLVDARGGAMRGCRHSGVRVIVPPRRASMPMRVTCRYLKRDKLSHPPPLMEGEALASRILELGPVGAKFLGPVMIEVPHFGSLRGKEREIVILRSDNGETWREHTVDCSEEAVQDVLSHSFDKEDLAQLDENARTTRILTTDFPHYFAVVTRVRQEVHAIGPEGGMVSSSVVPQVQAVFPQGALTKKIKVGLQAQPISAELAAKLLGNRVAVSPIVTVEPRRRKFHKPITLTIPKPQAANKGMINQYSGDAPTLRLLCSITGGTTRAQWEDVTGSTPFTFVNDCVSFTTTVSARFWLMDCRNVGDATKMATELYREAIHVPFMAKFVVFAKRVDPLEARLRIFCMTDDKEDKTLEHQEHFTEVAKSRDVEVLEGKTQYVEFAGNLVPVTKSGEQLQLGFRAFRENRLPFTVRVKDQHADCVGRTLFMREARLPKGEPPQQPICVLNIVLPDEIIPEAILPEHELHKYSFIQDSSGLESYKRVDLRLSDISNLLGSDWVQLADELGVTPSDINRLKSEHPHSVAQQGLAMLRLWVSQAGNKAQASTLESALSRLGRDDIVQQCVFNVDQSSLHLLKDESRDASIRRSIPYSDKDFMKDSESVEDLSRTSLRKTGDTVEKDDKEERKYEAEEKEVEEVRKSVSERRKEIEKRLSLENPLEKRIENICEKASLERGEDLSEKEIAEEKRVSSPEEEPSELSFEQKRLSFEQGKRVIEMKPDKTTMKEVKERADERFLAEERKAAEALQEKKSTVEETSISFQEKRKSFEQGLKEEKSIEMKEESKREDARKDSALFEGVSQGLVRLDAAFTAAPQVQDLLSPKVSKTPPPSPAEFKDITGTVAWTEEPVADVPVKASQSQDWADKGKPDPTIELSKKGTSRAGMEKDIEIPLQANINLPSNNKIPQQTSETIEVVTEHSSAHFKEKDSKYQFTMSVPDKKTFTETLNSITTFLESEKNYNNQIVKIDPDRLTAVAYTEVSSSDETEESQSRSESDPKSDKSFMGKMSKKLFGVFKKDDKLKSEKKKGKKKKHKKERGDSSDAQNCESFEPAKIVEKPEKRDGSESLTIKTSDGMEYTHNTETSSDNKQKLSITVNEEDTDFSIPIVEKKIKFEGIQTHTTDQRKDEEASSKKLASNIVSGGEKIVLIMEECPVKEKSNTHLKDTKSSKEFLEIRPTKTDSETDKIMGNAETGHSIEIIETKTVDSSQSNYEYSKSCEEIKTPVQFQTTDTKLKHENKEIELLQPLSSLVLEEITKKAHLKTDFDSGSFIKADNIPSDAKILGSKEEGERGEPTEKRKVKFSVDTADEIKKTTEDLKRKAVGVTFAIDMGDTESNFAPLPKETSYAERVNTSNYEEIYKLAGKNTVTPKMSMDESTETKDVSEEKPAIKDIPISSRDVVKGAKEKKKSFFGGLFGKSGENLKVKKGEASETIEKSQLVEHDFLDNSRNETESKISIDKKILKDVRDVEEVVVHGKVNDNFEVNIEDKTTDKSNQHEKDETTQIVYEPEFTTDEINQIDKDKMKITTSKEKGIKDLKGSKEKGKLFFSGVFGKAEDVTDFNKPKLDDNSLAHSEIRTDDKGTTAGDDWNVECSNLIFPIVPKPTVSMQIDASTNLSSSKTSEIVDTGIKEKEEANQDVDVSLTENFDTKHVFPPKIKTDAGKVKFCENTGIYLEAKKEETTTCFDDILEKQIIEEKINQLHKNEFDLETSKVLKCDDVSENTNCTDSNGKDSRIINLTIVEKFALDNNARNDSESSTNDVIYLDKNTGAETKTKTIKPDLSVPMHKTAGCEIPDIVTIVTTQIPSNTAENSSVMTTTRGLDERINEKVLNESVKNIGQISGKTDILNKSLLCGSSKENAQGLHNSGEITKVNVSENIKHTEGASNAFLSNIFSESEQLVNEKKRAVDDTVMHLSKNIETNKEKSQSISKSLIESSENVIPFQENKKTDASDHSNKMSADISDQTGTIDSGAVFKKEQLLEEGKLKLVEKLTLARNAIPTTGDLQDLSYKSINKISSTTSVTKPTVKTPQDIISVSTNESNLGSGTKFFETGMSKVFQETFNKDEEASSYFESGVTLPFQKNISYAHNLAENEKKEIIQHNVAFSDAANVEKNELTPIIDSTISSFKGNVDYGKSCLARNTGEANTLTTGEVSSFFGSSESTDMAEVKNNMKGNTIPEAFQSFDMKSEVLVDDTLSKMEESVNDVKTYVSDSALSTQKSSGIFDPTNIKTSVGKKIVSKGMHKVIESTNKPTCVFGNVKDQIESDKTQHTLVDALNDENVKTVGQAYKTMGESSDIFSNIDLKLQAMPGSASSERQDLFEARNHEFDDTPNTKIHLKENTDILVGDGAQHLVEEKLKNIGTCKVFEISTDQSKVKVTSTVDDTNEIGEFCDSKKEYMFNKCAEGIHEGMETLSDFAEKKKGTSENKDIDIEHETLITDVKSELHSIRGVVNDTLSEVKSQVTSTGKFQISKQHPEKDIGTNKNDALQSIQERSAGCPPVRLNQEIAEKNVQEGDDSKSNDDKLNKILIDMLIEQECIKIPSFDATELPQLDTHHHSVTEQPTSIPENFLSQSSEKEVNCGVFKAASSFGQIESLIKKVDPTKSQQKDEKIEQPCIVTTPTMQRRKIGGSQRLSREERPALRDVSHIIDYSSSEEDETNYYIVTEPRDRSPQRKVVFLVESEDETFVKVSDSNSEPEVEFTEISPSPDPSFKKQGAELAREDSEYFDERVKSKIYTEKNIQKVERRFERMASETLEADPVAKYTADREFQRMVSQLSNEEVDACLSQWEEGGLTPSEELDSTKDTIEGDIDPDVEALPEASSTSTNPFYSMSSQWVDFERDINDVPSSIFWAFDTMPTSPIIQPNQLDIPIKSVPDKGNPFTDKVSANINSLNSLKNMPEPPLCINTLGQSYSSSTRLPCALVDSPLGSLQLDFGGESAGEEVSKSPAPSSVRESEEALLDLATGLHDAKGSSSSSGPSHTK